MKITKLGQELGSPRCSSEPGLAERCYRRSIGKQFFELWFRPRPSFDPSIGFASGNPNITSNPNIRGPGENSTKEGAQKKIQGQRICGTSPSCGCLIARKLQEAKKSGFTRFRA